MNYERNKGWGEQNIAREIVRDISPMSQDEAEKLAFATARTTCEFDDGYGEGTRYIFGDGSSVRFDGRGWEMEGHVTPGLQQKINDITHHLATPAMKEKLNAEINVAIGAE